ncbi:MAG: acyl carrier protein [Proteobacteria bacterium]|nr:acyl carrier protein [Pseudomonadota bacterium]
MNQPVTAWITQWLAARRPGDAIALDPDTDLYKTGLLDSLGIIELIESLEDVYGFQFTEEEMQAGLTRVGDFERIIGNR